MMFSGSSGLNLTITSDSFGASDVSAFYQMVVKGLVILGAVALDRGNNPAD